LASLNDQKEKKKKKKKAWTTKGDYWTDAIVRTKQAIYWSNLVIRRRRWMFCMNSRYQSIRVICTVIAILEQYELKLYLPDIILLYTSKYKITWNPMK
jgi:hypothetical protein